MNAKRKWYEYLLPGLVVLLFLAAGIVEPLRAYEYVEDTSAGEGQGSPTDNGDSSYSEYAYATSVGDANTGSCWCTASSSSWAHNNSASASVYSAAWYQIDWTWNGPPGNAPGGTLSWSLDSDGYASVEGKNYLWNIGDTASSGASADCGGDLSATEGSADGDIEAWGYVDDLSTGYVDASGSGSPSADYSTTPDPPDDYGRVGPGKFDIVARYDIDSGDDESISSGTTYIYVSGGADCYAGSSASSSGGVLVDADSVAWSEAGSSVSGSFSSN